MNSLALTETKSTEIVPRRLLPNGADLTDISALGSVLVKSGYFADAREQAQAAVKVMAGAELGIPPIASMMGINIIKGKVAMGAHLIASRVRAHGYDFRVKKLDNTGCVLEFLSKPGDKGKRDVLGESSFNEDDAKTAQCFTDMYRKYPRNMYWSRCVSNGAKWYCSEVMSGMPVYVPEELGAEVDSEGEMIHPPQPQAQGKPHWEDSGSQAAANDVRDRKIAELKAGKPAAVVDAEVRKDDSSDWNVEPEIQLIWARMGIKPKPVLEAFAEKKAEMVEVMGPAGESEYYRHIYANGPEYKHANDFVRGATASINKARRTIAEMCRAIKAAREMMQPVNGFQATDDDLPPELA